MKKKILFIFLLLIILFITYYKNHKDIILKPYNSSILLLDCNGKYLADIETESGLFGYWPLPDIIPDKIIKSTLAAEDHRFYSHNGVDVHSILRAFWSNLKNRKIVSGASTLAMQTARLQNPGKRTFLKKINEAFQALILTKKYGRINILRQYLKIAPYGNRAYGINYAARKYFKKPIQDLSWGEAVLLASLPQSPGKMNFTKEIGKNLIIKRAKFILDRLIKLNWISKEDYEYTQKELQEFKTANIHKDKIPDTLIHAVLDIKTKIKNNESIKNKYSLKTTIDIDLQERVFDIANEAIIQYRDYGADNIAVLIVDKHTGGIVSYIGSDDYFYDKFYGKINFVQTLRSSGSTLKPFIYAFGMSENGYTAAHILKDVGFLLNFKDGKYFVRNYDEKFLGPILYRDALANSRNLPAIEVLQNVGIDVTYDKFKKLGLADIKHNAEYYGLGMSIGGIYVTLYNLVQAYGVLACDGKEFQLKFFTDENSNINKKQLIPEDIARQITLFLADPMARLPGFSRMSALEYPFPVAVKTGTSQGFKDAWAIAYSKDYIVGVWIGNANCLPMKRLTGSISSAKVIKQIMFSLHPEDLDGLREIEFPAPKGYKEYRICKLTGKLATTETPYTATERFKPGTEPKEYSDIYKRISIDIRTGLESQGDCPEKFKITKIFVNLPNEFAIWAKESGFE
ncbi:transglycosylase domain-containing protein, partial [Candidatus Desantisbacteria bacterium]|nr:transglycosylase domain-containing protein [Candidatus Desantisbacteria bacterium]